MRAFRKVFFWEMKFALSIFLSYEDLSISYESWDVQLTFDTLINAFRFKAYWLGGAKFENVCFTKLAEFRKSPPFLQFSSKLSDFFFGERSVNSVFLQNQIFGEHTFLTRMRHQKNGWTLSAPPVAYFYHP